MSTLTPSDLGNRPIILGTSSKYRHALFRNHFPSLPFSTSSPSLDERAITLGHAHRSTSDPSALTLAIASAKASSLLPSLPPTGLLLTSDQVLSHDSLIREKPADAHQCRLYLRSYAAHPVVTVTAVVITDLASKRSVHGVHIATQHLKPLPEHLIDALIAKGDVLHCAGGITIEDPLLTPFLLPPLAAQDSIMGLPVTLVHHLLCKACASPPI